MAAPQAQLAEAFAAFNTLSAELAQAYEALERRVAELSRELAAAHDARLRELAEKERLAERLGGILDALPGAVVVLDGAGRVCEANPAARQWLGEPLQGERWQEVAARALEPDGQGGWRLAAARHVDLATRELGAGAGRIVLLTDQTEARRLREQAERNGRLAAMGEMVARLAHQLRTPLTSALLYVSQLAGRSLEPEAGRRLARKGLARLRQLERMVDDMLGYARGGAGPVTRVELGDLATELTATLEPQLAEREARLDPALPPRLSVTGNREALLGALLNLATNALEAGARCLRLQAEARPAQVVIRFSDDGPGIPAPLRARVFEPFFTTRSDGTGLGLAVVRAVVEAHGGRIALEAAEAGGTCFRIELPRGEAARPLPSGAQGAAAHAFIEEDS